MSRRHLLFSLLSIAMFSAPPWCAADSIADHQLRQAVATSDLGAVRVLLANGADIECKDESGATPLLIATENRNIQVVKLLLDRGANVSARNSNDETPLISAAGSMNPELVRVILDRGPGLQDKNAALFEAVKSGPVIIEMSDTPAPNPTSPPATAVSEMSWVTVVRILLDSGAELNARDQSRSTPLIDAAAYAQTAVVHLLLERGANVQARDKDGNTALIAASCECALSTMNSAYDVVKVLLEKGSDVNAHSNDGTTALMNAAGGFGGSAIVKLLLDHGADPRARDSKGNTALKYAMEANREDKVLLLKQAMAKIRKG